MEPHVLGDNMYFLQNPFIPTFRELRSVSTSACQHVQSNDGDGISESGWTMYLDQSRDTWTYNSKNLFDLQENFSKSGTYNEQAKERSIIADDQEEDPSMASDASSGPQQPLPVQEFGQTINGCSKRSVDGVPVGKQELDCSASCSLSGLNTRTRKKCRRVEMDEVELLKDTASSPVRSSKSGLAESEVNKEQNLEVPAGVADFEGEWDLLAADKVNARLKALQSLLPDGSKICREKVVGVAIEYINTLERRIKPYFQTLEKEAHAGEEDKRIFCVREEMGLQKRGMCLVPFSMLGVQSDP
eukprot:Gb_31545 [translate_table: standard]